MMQIDRRKLLMALGCLAAQGCGSPYPASIFSEFGRGISSIEAKAISLSYKKGVATRYRKIGIERLANLKQVNAVSLRGLVISDFENARVYVHKGWHLSHIEGEIFSGVSRL